MSYFSKSNTDSKSIGQLHKASGLFLLLVTLTGNAHAHGDNLIWAIQAIAIYAVALLVTPFVMPTGKKLLMTAVVMLGFPVSALAGSVLIGDLKVYFSWLGGSTSLYFVAVFWIVGLAFYRRNHAKSTKPP